jgi:hypothetical protein
MRTAAVGLAVTAWLLSGCATTRLKESTNFWNYERVAEQRVTRVLAASVWLTRWGETRMVRVRARTETGELADYYENSGGAAWLELARRGFKVESEFRAVGNAPCVLLEAKDAESVAPELPLGTLVHHVDTETGAVDPRATPLREDEAPRAIVLLFLVDTGKLWVSVPPPNGRPVASSESARSVKLTSDGGRAYRFRAPVDGAYVRSAESVAWFYAHLPLTLAFDACFLPFSIAGVALHAWGLDDPRAPLLGPDRDPVKSPLVLPTRERRPFEKPWEPPGPPVSLDDPEPSR